MVQELGETTQEMMKADEKAVEDILTLRPSGHYWILIHHKPIHKVLNTGQRIIRRVVKAYDKKPENLLGTIVLEVKDGEIIDTKINLHDMPMNWAAIIPKAGLIENPYVQHRPDIGHNYVYNN